jgi:hypothetical protein
MIESSRKQLAVCYTVVAGRSSATVTVRPVETSTAMCSLQCIPGRRQVHHSSFVGPNFRICLPNNKDMVDLLHTMAMQ